MKASVRTAKPRVSKTLDQCSSHWISRNGNHNRYRASCLFSSLGGRRVYGDDDIQVESDEFGGKLAGRVHCLSGSAWSKGSAYHGLTCWAGRAPQCWLATSANGPQATSCDVRDLVAIRGKADVRRTSCQGRL